MSSRDYYNHDDQDDDYYDNHNIATNFVSRLFSLDVIMMTAMTIRMIIILLMHHAPPDKAKEEVEEDGKGEEHDEDGNAGGLRFKVSDSTGEF